jgi:hypothetical protein
MKFQNIIYIIFNNKSLENFIIHSVLFSNKW